MICPYYEIFLVMNLPLDMWRYIFTFVSGWTIIKKLTRVSRSFNKLAKDKVTWKMLCNRLDITIIEEELPEKENRYQWLWLCKNNKLEAKDNVIINKIKCIGYFANYEGGFKNGLANGFGKYRQDDGLVVVGNYKDGLIKRYARVKLGHGDFYKGDYLKNLMCGFGVYIWSNGDQYEGYWYNNLQQGPGHYIWVYGNSYKGEYNEHNMHGHGVYKFRDGHCYTGEWCNGVRHGYGKLLKDDVVLYDGKWKNDLPKKGFKNIWNGFHVLNREQRNNFMKNL